MEEEFYSIIKLVSGEEIFALWWESSASIAKPSDNVNDSYTWRKYGQSETLDGYDWWNYVYNSSW